jgi:hypothetical protein
MWSLVSLQHWLFVVIFSKLKVIANAFELTRTTLVSMLLPQMVHKPKVDGGAAAGRTCTIIPNYGVGCDGSQALHAFGNISACSISMSK